MPQTTPQQIDALHHMTTSELVERYAQLHGQPCRTRHRAYVIRKIAWRIQALAEGDLSERARRRAAELADDAEVWGHGAQDPDLPTTPAQGPSTPAIAKGWS